MSKELIFIYSLVFIVILLIIVVVLMDRKEKIKEKNKKSLSDTLTMKPISEDMIDMDLTNTNIFDIKSKKEKEKINLEKLDVVLNKSKNILSQKEEVNDTHNDLDNKKK